jgi:hypothetical protein
MFDVPNVPLKPGQTLDQYLERKAEGIRQCWEPDRGAYLDVSALPLDWRTTNGALPLVFLVDNLRARGSRVIPVTGTRLDRDVAYVSSVRDLCAQDADGVCLRLARDELLDRASLRESVQETVELLRVDPSSIDVVLDFRFVGMDRADRLRGWAMEALQVFDRIAAFRNVSIAASSIPELLPKKDTGVVRREPRIELPVWSELIKLFSGTHPFADYGVVGAHYVPPGKPVNTPARIRYTTQEEHIFLRGGRTEHGQISRQLLELQDFAGAEYSVGDQRLAESATGKSGPGNAGLWVGYDANHHLEFVSEQTWSILQQAGKAALFTFADPQRRPWLQRELFRL